jgi:hypothetical protein
MDSFNVSVVEEWIKNLDMKSAIAPRAIYIFPKCIPL